MDRAISLSLADEGGANPAGYEPNISTLTVDLILQRRESAIFAQVDISSSEEVEVAFDRSIAKFGWIDILISCAGYWAPFRKFDEEDDEVRSKIVVVNFLKQDVDSKWGSRGRIINISSCAGHFGFPGEVAYSSTKASIDHMTHAGALEYANDYININCIGPGVVATGEIIGLMKRATPWPQMGTAEDIAGAILYFCLPQSHVDGGMTIGVASSQ
ncbi:NAD(P)-binding protein [Cenococcum geophilum]